MKALVTGITGFIGGRLAQRLLAEGYAVRGTARSSNRSGWLATLVDGGAEIVPGDLLDQNALNRAVNGCDIVLHAGAWTGGPELTDDQAWATNVTATEWLLQAASRANVRHFLYFSSVAVYGVNTAPVIDETAATPRVGQLYPDSKIAAEARVHSAQATGLPATIIRPACTYGPRGGAWTINPIQQIKAGRLVLLGRDQGLVNTGYIENLVDGVLLALRNRAAVGETFNLCDGTTVTFRQFYLTYAAMLGKDTLPTWPAWVARGAISRPGKLVRRLAGRPLPGPWSYHFRFNPSRFSIDKAQRVLAYQPRISYAQGMQRTEAWLREAGYLSADRQV